MNWEIFIESKLVQDLGWTLIHSVWQIALVSAVLFAAMKSFTKLSAETRYLLSVSALLLSFALPALTFVQFSSKPNSPISHDTQYNETVKDRPEGDRSLAEKAEGPWWVRNR